jgi:heme-degrading monooxygenase HmoA
MMTIITHVTLRQGAEPEWDAAMRQRMMAARDQPGWIGGQILLPLDGLNRRVIIGTWQTRAHWETWHADAAFAETRRRLAGLEVSPREDEWYEVVEEIRRPVTALGSGDIAA